VTTDAGTGCLGDGVSMRSSDVAYALRLDPGERERYRMMAAAARQAEVVEWAHAGIGPGASVADVGCGPGALLRLLADEVGADGRADGVDGAADAVEAARAEVGHLPQASVRLGDAAATGLPTGAFDAVMCRHVLAHNGGREAEIVGHLAELARPGGTVYLVDVDHTMLWMSPSDPDVADLHGRYLEYQTGRGNDLQVGRSLGPLLEGAGLAVEVFRMTGPIIRAPAGVRSPGWAARGELIAAGLATDPDVARWDAAFRRMDALAERPWAGMPVTVAVGRRS
jgi:SAM-dependent methyltransferase